MTRTSANRPHSVNPAATPSLASPPLALDRCARFSPDAATSAHEVGPSSGRPSGVSGLLRARHAAHDPTIGSAE